MDWPKIDFCVLLWVLCVSKALGDSTALISSKEPKCGWGDILPRKDECNTCICFEGDVHCTNLPCRARERTDDQPECQKGQPAIKLDECNVCYCFDGKLDCSDLICIRGSKCTAGQEIPPPDNCNICNCFDGHIVCTNYECNPRSKRRPNLAENATTDSEAITNDDIATECEANDYIPPPPPPFDCNKCVCLNHKVFCTMESCNDDVPDVNTRFNLQNEPNDNLEVYDKKISVDPYLNLFYKNYDKTPTKLVHTHAYNGFHQEIKVHSKNLSQDTSKLIKALASSLDNPVLGQIGDKIKSSSSNFNKPTKLSGGPGVQNYIPNAPYSNEISMEKHSPNLSDINPLHSLSSLITSGSQSNETILVIPSKHKTFLANRQPHLIAPYSSESADLTFEQKKPYYSTTHSNMSPREPFNTFDSRNKDLIHQSPLPVIPIHSDTNNEDMQLSAPYTMKNDPGSPNNAYNLNQVQNPNNLNKYSNSSTSHPIHNLSQEQLKFSSNVNDAQYAQPHSQLGPNTVYRPYQNEPLQNRLQPIQNNQYPTSNIQYNPINPSKSQFAENHTNPVGDQNLPLLPDQDSNYPRNPYKLNPSNYNHYQTDPSQNEYDPDQGKPVFGSDNRGSQISPLYTSIELNPAIYNGHQLNAPHSVLQPDQSQHKLTSSKPTQDTNPTQMRLHEKKDLSAHDRNNPYLPHSKFEPNPSIYKMHPTTEPENGFVHSQEINKPHTGYDFTQNGYKPEQDKNATILDDRRPHNLHYPQFEPNPLYHHNQQFTPPQHGYQADHNKQQPRPLFELNQTQINPNIYQTHYPNSQENIHQSGQDDHTQPNNAHLQENNLPSMGPNQEERLSTLDNKGNRYNVTNSHYKTHSSVSYVTQYVPTHEGKNTDHSPAISNSDNSFNLHHPAPNRIALNGRGKGTDFEYINQMNSNKPEFLPFQRENELDPTVVKVYQYLNQPKIIYPPKQNENYPHITSHTPATKNYPALHQESLQHPPWSSMSVEDDKNRINNSEYPTNLHSQSPLWDSGYHDKDRNPINYPTHNDVSPSFYSGKYDNDKVPKNNSLHAYNTPEDLPVSSRYYTVPFQKGQYDKNKIPVNKSSYANNVPEEFPVLSPYQKLSLQIGKYGKNKVPINTNSYNENQDMPPSSSYYPPTFKTRQYDKNKSPFNKSSYAHNVPEEFPVLSPHKTLSFQKGQYDKNKVPINNSHYSQYDTLQPESSPVGSRNKSPLLNSVQYDDNKVPIGYNPYTHNGSQPEASPIISQKKSSLFNTLQYDKNKLPINFNKYAHNNAQPEVPLISLHNKSSIWELGHYDKHKIPVKYDTYAHNSSQPEASPVVSYNKSPSLYTAQYDKSKVPINYEPRAHNVSQIEASPSNSRYPLYLTSLQHDGTGVPINKYGITSHPPDVVKNPLQPWELNNISQPEASPVSSNNKSPSLHTAPYDKNKVPINYEPRAHKISQTETSPSNSWYPPNLTSFPYDGTGIPINNYGLTNHAPKDEQNPRQPWELNNISQPEASPVSSNNKSPSLHTAPYDKNKVPINYEPRAHKISQTETSPSNSRYPPNLTSFPYDGTGIPINNYGLTNHAPKDEQNPRQPWEQNNKNTLPIYEQVNIDDIILTDPLSNSSYSQFPTSTSEQYGKNKFPINEHQNNPHKVNLNDNISSFPLSFSDPQDQSVDRDPSQQRLDTGNVHDHVPVNGFQYIYQSAEDPNSSINKPNKSVTNSQQQPDSSFLDERGSLDGFQYKSTSDEDSDTPKANLNKNTPAKGLLHESKSLNVIPYNHNYANYSPYPKQNNDPRSQYNFIQNSPVSVNNPGPQKESQNEFKFAVDPKNSQIDKNQTPLKSILPQKTSAFDDRGAHDGFQYISNSDEESQNKPDHDQFKHISEKNKSSLSSKLESTAYPENDDSIVIDVDSINPDILKLLQNANKPLSIDDLMNEIDSHKKAQLKPNDDSSTSVGLSDENDELQSRFNDLFADSFPQLQTNKKITGHPPIDDSEFYISELDPVELLRLLFPMKYNQAPGKNNGQLPLNEKDLHSLLLSTQNMYTSPKNKKTSSKEKKIPNDDDLPQDSPSKSKKKNKSTPQENPVPSQTFNNVDPKNIVKDINNLLPQQHQTNIQNPSTTGQNEDPSQYKQVAKVSDESLNFPPIQYPDVHIILHQRNVGDNNDQPQYLVTGVDGNDFEPSLLHSRLKRPKEQKEECGEGSKWVRNCHVCSCRGGQAFCSKIPDCVLRLLEEPMMCKPYSKFKIGSCYSCECNGDGIPECDASECKTESKYKESDEDSDETKSPVYQEFFEDVKAKAMLSYYTFFKKLPKDTSDAINYPTCETGTHWVSSCHNCECKDNQKHGCTKIKNCVLDLETLGKPGKCKPNSQFYPKSTNMACQKCSCDDEGNPSCPLTDDKTGK